MGVYAFISTNHFLCYSVKVNNLQIYELRNPDSLPLTFHDWKLVVSIGPYEEYDSLKVFEAVIDGIRLKNLEEDLCYSHLMINPEGFCYLDTTEIVGSTFNVQYYKLNDLFCWSEYVDVPSKVTLKTSWKQCGIQTGESLLDYDQNSGDLEEKNTLLKQTKDELESTRRKFDTAKNELKLLGEELKKKQDESYDASNKIFQYERRLEDKDMKLQRLREKLSSNQIKLDEMERNNKTQSEELLVATNELKLAKQELKQKCVELSDANEKNFQYRSRLEEKDEKMEELRDNLSFAEAKLQELQNYIKQQNEESKSIMRNETPQTSSSKATSDSGVVIDMQKETLLNEWQKLTEVWNHNREDVVSYQFRKDLGVSSIMGKVLHSPQVDITPLREFTPMKGFTHPHNGFTYIVKSNFDGQNWWCIGSYEHRRKIDLIVYDGRYGSIKAYDTKVYVPYQQNYFFSSAQCFVGFLRGVGFKFMYVSARSKR